MNLLTSPPQAGRGRLASSDARRVRGSIRERGRNGFQNSRDIAEDIIIPEVQNLIVVIGEPFITDHVMPVVSMLSAIHLNDESGFAANKADGVWADRFLPNKFVTVERA